MLIIRGPYIMDFIDRYIINDESEDGIPGELINNFKK